MNEKRVVITGATGMVGGCALRLCLENPDVSQVTAIGRKSNFGKQ
jgi:aspartate-semialdehyde dehydrogenase